MLEYEIYKEVIKDLEGNPHVFFETVGYADTYDEACDWIKEESLNEPDTVFHIVHEED